MREGMLGTLNAEFITAARAKGERGSKKGRQRQAESDVAQLPESTHEIV